MLDTYREVHTPEGVALRLPAAGPVPRALAWGIDLAIRLGIMMLGLMVLGVLGKAGVGVMSISVFLLMWAYPVVFEGAFDGQTPGKRVMGLRVVSADGAPVGWLAAFLRNLLRTADMLPFGYAIGLVSSLADPWGRRLGDRVAGTMVVHAPKPAAAPAVLTEAPHPPPQVLLPAEQAAVVAFAERALQLTAERQAELADIARPLTGAGGALGVRRLASIAQWLLGRR